MLRNLHRALPYLCCMHFFSGSSLVLLHLLSTLYRTHSLPVFSFSEDYSVLQTLVF